MYTKLYEKKNDDIAALMHNSKDVLNVLMYFFCVAAYSIDCYSCFPDTANGKTCQDLEEAEIRKCKPDQNVCIKTILDKG